MVEVGIETTEVQDELRNTAELIKSSVSVLETVKVLYGDDQADCGAMLAVGPELFAVYLQYNQDPDTVDPSTLSINYMGLNWAFTRATGLSNGYRVFILVSKEAVDSVKKGLIIMVADAEHVIIAATCKADDLRQANCCLMSLMEDFA
ncbi:hypothetical protein PAPHI01_0854 [Pancytospora philotis]|nr:hypothetical protein PAPHI01_0854 [Pancytospora philotis]